MDDPISWIGTKIVPASVTAIKYKIDVNTREHLAAQTLMLNEIGFCNISTATPVVFPQDRIVHHN